MWFLMLFLGVCLGVFFGVTLVFHYMADAYHYTLEQQIKYEILIDKREDIK